MSESLRKRVARAIIQREHNLTPEMAARTGCSICTDAADAAIAIVLEEALKAVRTKRYWPSSFTHYDVQRAIEADILAALEMTDG